MATPSDFDKRVSYKPRRPDANIRLICVPWSGGSSLGFASFRKLPKTIEVVTYDPPGRVSRMQEPFMQSVDEIAEDCIAALVELKLLEGKPFALFGHSLGAKVVYEMTRKMQARGLPTPVILFISATRACQLPRNERIISTLPRAELLDEIVTGGGVTREIANNTEFIDPFIPIIRADYSVNERYVHSSDMTKVTCCPMVVYGGRSDAWPEQDMLDWSDRAGAGFECKMFPGAHFYFKEQEPQVFSAMTLALNPWL